MTFLGFAHSVRCVLAKVSAQRTRRPVLPVMTHDDNSPEVIQPVMASDEITADSRGTSAPSADTGDAPSPGHDAVAADHVSAGAPAQADASNAAAPEAPVEAAKPKKKKKSAKVGPKPNNVRRIRIERMMSKAELARSANLSVLTIDRVEKGFGCRVGTKRKILEALGLSLADRVRVFGEEE